MIQQETLRRMIVTLDEFRAIMESELAHSSVDFESVLSGYAACHRELARGVRRLAEEEEYESMQALSETAETMGRYLQLRLGDAVPSKYLTVGEPGKTRSGLLAYLLRNLGRHVSAERLRAISGDQIHTERRVRELRDYGYGVESGVVSGETCYILVDEVPDSVDAAWRAIFRNLDADRKLPIDIRSSLTTIIREREAEYRSADMEALWSRSSGSDDCIAEGTESCSEDV